MSCPTLKSLLKAGTGFDSRAMQLQTQTLRHYKTGLMSLFISYGYLGQDIKP